MDQPHLKFSFLISFDISIQFQMRDFGSYLTLHSFDEAILNFGLQRSWIRCKLSLNRLLKVLKDGKEDSNFKRKNVWKATSSILISFLHIRQQSCIFSDYLYMSQRPYLQATLSSKKIFWGLKCFLFFIQLYCATEWAIITVYRNYCNHIWNRLSFITYDWILLSSY